METSQDSGQPAYLGKPPEPHTAPSDRAKELVERIMTMKREPMTVEEEKRVFPRSTLALLLEVAISLKHLMDALQKAKVIEATPSPDFDDIIGEMTIQLYPDIEE
jgi:hypothetical protein